jgi:hypothetical protein
MYVLLVKKCINLVFIIALMHIQVSLPITEIDEHNCPIAEKISAYNTCVSANVNPCIKMRLRLG